MLSSFLNQGIVPYILIFLISILCSYFSLGILIPRLKRFGYVGKDMHKESKPEIPEMGGIAIAIGFSAGILAAIMLSTFFGLQFNITYVLAGLVTILALSLIGIIDDMLDIPQWAKAFLPLFSAIPLIAVTAAGSTAMAVPFVGSVDFGLLYIIALIPVGVAVASNLTNMLAGFNGMEAGMGSIIFIGMIAIASAHQQPEMLVLYIPMLGALLGFLPKNLFPAKIFPGDIGTLTIGAVLATGVIIGNMESIGAMMLILYVLDFLIKLPNRFPKTFAIVKEGKLYSPPKPRGLVDVVLKLMGGAKESTLVLVFMGMQAVVAIGLMLLFARV